MPLYINTNVASLNAQRNMLSSSGELGKVFARLSSGKRINTAGDDAAGLAITNRMTAQVRGLTQAIRNANDGISVSQVAEGALSENSNMLQRINELAVQAANATNSPADRESLQAEVVQLLSEIERVAQETEFNNWPMLNGQTKPLVFQVGARENQTVTIELADARASVLMAQPVLADPNRKESVLNPKIEGLSISAPSPALVDSKLFSAEQAPMISAVASANTNGVAPATLLSDEVADNMVKAAEGSVTVAPAVEAAISTIADSAKSGLRDAANALGTTPTVQQVSDGFIDKLSVLPVTGTVARDAITAAAATGATAATVAAAAVAGPNATAGDTAAATAAAAAANLTGATAATVAAAAIEADAATASTTDVTAAKTAVLAAINTSITAGDNATSMASDISAANGAINGADALALASAALAANSGKSGTDVAVAVSAYVHPVSTAINTVLGTSNPTVSEVSNAVTTALSLTQVPDSAVLAAINASIVDGDDFEQMAVDITAAAGSITNDDAKALAAAALAAFGRSTDGKSTIAGGSTPATVLAAAIAIETVVTTDPTIDNDKARVLAAATYAATRDYSSTGTNTDGVPGDLTQTKAPGIKGDYRALAGEKLGEIATAVSITQVVDDAVTDGTLVKDVPVGNILDVIAAFDHAISQNKDVESIAKAALAADKGTELTLEEAKIIAAAGLAAAQPGGTVAKAATAGVNMSKVLAARDAAAAAASAPSGGEQITVPSWLLDLTGQNTFPPTPLVDITGASIPTDPTLPFDPPTTDASNPPLNGQQAAARMLDIVSKAIDRVSSTRAELGAIENRFTSNIANLSNVVENVSAARSRILDADIALETANLTKLAIMQQAGVAILAQANQQPQLALQLLG